MTSCFLFAGSIFQRTRHRRVPRLFLSQDGIQGSDKHSGWTEDHHAVAWNESYNPRVGCLPQRERFVDSLVLFLKRQRTWQSTRNTLAHLLTWVHTFPSLFAYPYLARFHFCLTHLLLLPNEWWIFSVTYHDLYLSCLSSSGGKLSFADFLDVMHTHSKKEKIPQEIIDAFDALDPRKTGHIPTRDLKHILTEWGEHLESKEVENLLNEAHASHRQSINYHDLIRVICAPVPDY